ncbi:MAG: hypothetical protein ACI8XO_002755 [Verrucomicrobiales bacterium]|jgi:hypothetical protein
MKIPTLLPALILYALSTSAPAEDEEEWKSPPKQAAFLFEWIELEHRQANQLVRRYAGNLSAAKLRAELGRRIEANSAKLLHSAYLISKFGQRAKSEAVDEIIYPTEYDPPEIPSQIENGTRAETLKVIPANATAFDVRNAGTTVELEPLLSTDQKFISLRLASEIVRHLGDRSAGGDPKIAPESIAVIKQPAFYTMSTDTQLTIKVGDFALAAMFTPPGKTGKRILLLIRATTPS